MKLRVEKNRSTTEHFNVCHDSEEKKIYDKQKKNGTDDNEYQIDVGKMNTHSHTHTHLFIEPHNVIIHVACRQVVAETGVEEAAPKKKEAKEEEIKEIRPRRQ